MCSTYLFFKEWHLKIIKNKEEDQMKELSMNVQYDGTS